MLPLHKNSKEINVDMTDEEVIQGLKRGDGDITQRFFYGYLRIAYRVYDERYGLHNKADMDFYSLAHDYYMRLLMGDWQQLDARRADVSLRTWLTNGFRFLILDKLKTYRPTDGGVEGLRFDVPDDHFAEDVRAMLEEVIDTRFVGDRRSQGILRMILIGGYKSKEVAAQLGVTPSAVSQRYRQMMDTVIIPYFKRNFTSEAGTYAEAQAPNMLENEAIYGDFYPLEKSLSRSVQESPSRLGRAHSEASSYNQTDMDKRRVTPELITQLGENEIFVFGSNLAGMHGGGAAYIALKKFGAKLGQGVGLQGQSYGIPTMQGGVETIAPYVDEFIAFAREHKELQFLVTRIGCGIAGFDAEEIAPLFVEAKDVENISLPLDFWDILK